MHLERAGSQYKGDVRIHCKATQRDIKKVVPDEAKSLDDDDLLVFRRNAPPVMVQIRREY